MLAGWAVVMVVTVLCGTRVLAIFISVRGVPAAERASVLRALAQVFRWWRWRN
jgi:hypothetical protein